MVARSQKKINRDHALNKQVRREKARLRARGPKKHPQKHTITAKPRVHIKLEAEAKEALMKYCFEHNVKPYKAIRQILTMMVNKDWQTLKEKISKKELEELTSGI